MMNVFDQGSRIVLGPEDEALAELAGFTVGGRQESVTATAGSASAVVAEKPYYSKRPHKKSRTGCRNCKVRKVKCDEARPSCRACVLRRAECVYPTPAPEPAVDGRPSILAQTEPCYKVAAATSAVLSLRGPRQGRRPRADEANGNGSLSSRSASSDDGMAMNVRVVAEPQFCPTPDVDAVDMKLLWFYTTNTFQSFSPDGGRGMRVDDVLRVDVVQHAFASPFLMNCLLGLTVLHLQYLGQPDVVPAPRAIAYRARTFEGYRRAIEAADPSTYPALLACSLLLCALSSQMFREPDTKPLYVVDWMMVWRGIGLIIDLIRPQALVDSGMQVLFHRPRLDLDSSAAKIPNNLLFMVSSIPLGDPDFEHRDTYYDTLKYLGSLYGELEAGFSPILDLRLVTFFTFVPKNFITVARMHRPRALVILAHYLAFTKVIDRVWWMENIADREIRNICDLLDSSSSNTTNPWTSLLHVPRTVVQLTSKYDIARVLLNNSSWDDPDAVNRYEGPTLDPRVQTLTWVDDTGKEVDLREGAFIRKSESESSPPSSVTNATATTTATTTNMALFPNGIAGRSSSSSPDAGSSPESTAGTVVGVVGGAPQHASSASPSSPASAAITADSPVFHPPETVDAITLTLPYFHRQL